MRGAVPVTITLAAFSCVAMGQDSVSNTNGLPGDAVSAQAASNTLTINEQANNFVLDLSTVTSSWGGSYRVGPVAKASLGSSGFFTQLIAGTAASNRFVVGPFARTSYDAWHAAGQGVNALQDFTPVDDGSGNYGPRSTVALTGHQFAIAFMEFGGGPDFVFGNGDDEQNVIVALAGFEDAAPGRLYVSRVVGAVNKPSTAGGQTGTASLGVGGVDASGAVSILADGFGMTSASAISDKRLIRVNSTSRGTGLNQLSNSGATDASATTTLLANQTLQTTPAFIPAGVAGRTVAASMDFAGAYLFEASAGTLSSTATWAAAGESPRGPVSTTADGFSRLNTSGTSVATVAVLSKTAAGTRTRSVNLWGAGSNGAITGTLRIDLPTTGLVDSADGFDPSVTWGALANQEFTNFASQVSFRGPSGPVAMTVLPSGELLVAGTVAATGNAASLPQSMDNYIAVAKVPVGAGAPTWTIAAHTGNALGAGGGASKVILGDNGADGIPGNADAGEGDGAVDRGPTAWIGRIARASEGPQGISNGPSISAPAMDRLGNLYFLASTMFKTLAGNRFSTSLIRANYDPATGKYELERLLDVGDVIAGQNSTRNYQIQFMGVADADSIDSGAIFPSSIVQDVGPGVTLGSVAYGSPDALGALVVRCKIVYDRDNSGTFADPSVQGNSGSPDQGYNVAMIVMPGPHAPADPVDFNGDGEVNPDDLGDFITAFFSEPPDPRADFNHDGDINPDDLGDFITAFFAH